MMTRARHAVVTARLAFRETIWRAVWFVFLMLVLVTCLTMPPTWWWFEVRSVFVHDAVEGSTPLLVVDRTIHREFRGRWIATVMREGEGGFYTFCTARGENDYSPDARLPQPVDLNWWTWPTVCILPAGRYQLRTLWAIDPVWLPSRELRIATNVFSIYPRPPS
jgi:hypothetical protein